MRETYIHLIASQKEKLQYDNAVSDCIHKKKCTPGYWFLNDEPADGLYPGVEKKFAGKKSLGRLNEIDSEKDQCILLSIYDLDLVRSLYLQGIHNICCTVEPEVWVESQDPDKAVLLQSKYLESGNYKLLKRLNRIRMIFSFLQREAEIRSYPIDLQIEATSYCNAECIMCGHYIYRNAIARHMDQKLISELDEYLKYAETVILHGYGEPFMQPHLAEQLDKYREYGLKAVTNTNLSVLPEEILKRIPEMFSEITVSIDGCTAQIYEGIRRKLSFDTLICNLKRLNEKAPSVPKKVAMAIMRQNLHQIPAMVRFAKQYGFSGVNFIAMASSPYAGNQKDEVWKYRGVLIHQLRDAVKEAEQLGVELEMPVPESELERDTDPAVLQEEWEQINRQPFFPDRDDQCRRYEQYVLPRLSELKERGIKGEYSDYTSAPLTSEQLQMIHRRDSFRGQCDSLMMRPYINSDGKVFACCLHTKSFMGQLDENHSLAQVWNNELFRRMRSMFYEGSIPAYCGQCSFMDNRFLKLGNRS